MLLNPKFTNLFTGAYHLSLFWAMLFQFIPSHLIYACLVFPSSLFPWSYSTITVSFPLSPTCATCPTGFIHHELISEKYLLSSPKHEAHHYVVLSSLLLLSPSYPQTSFPVTCLWTSRGSDRLSFIATYNRQIYCFVFLNSVFLSNMWQNKIFWTKW